MSDSTPARQVTMSESDAVIDKLRSEVAAYERTAQRTATSLATVQLMLALLAENAGNGLTHSEVRGATKLLIEVVRRINTYPDFYIPF